MKARFLSILLLSPALTLSPAQAQEGSDVTTEGVSPVYCKSRGPSIFTGRANAPGCVPATAQPRCKVQRASIFTGNRSTGTCVAQAAELQTTRERHSIFTGAKRRSQPAAAYAAAPSQPVVMADGTVVQQPAPVTAQPGTAPAKPKRRRASIFTGGARQKD